jgi:hypothetical protein
MDRPKLDKEKAKIRLRFCQGWIEDIEELKEIGLIELIVTYVISEWIRDPSSCILSI